MSSQKKVIVRRFQGDSIAGYLPNTGFLERDAVSLLDLSGRLTSIALPELKFIAYVRDFHLSEAGNVEKSIRRSFLARPRTEGLWVRVTFRSGDLLEGITAPGLTLVDELLDVRGLQLTLPDSRANAHRVYIPRSAITQLDMLGLIASASHRRRTAKKPDSQVQDELFKSSETGAPPPE